MTVSREILPKLSPSSGISVCLGRKSCQTLNVIMVVATVPWLGNGAAPSLVNAFDILSRLLLVGLATRCNAVASRTADENSAEEGNVSPSPNKVNINSM
jgi:hypothetical protein